MRALFVSLALAFACAPVVSGCGSSHHSGGGGTPTPSPAPQGLTVTTTSLPAVPVGQSYNQQLTASGASGNVIWTLIGGSLPPNVTLGPGGVLSGPATTAGMSTFTVRAQDSSGATAQQGLSIVVLNPVTLTPQTIPNGTHGVAYSTTIMASGGNPPYSWTVSGAPPGISINANSGLLSGTPTTPGTYTTQVTAKDSTGNQSLIAYNFVIN